MTPYPVRIFGSFESARALVLDDLLRRIPGFSLFRRTGSLAANPTTQGASLRGIGPSGASRALVLFDGAPFNDAFGGWVYWGQLDTGAIDRVEVVRGGGSAAWGNTALGGVIQVLPKLPEQSLLSAEFSAGSHGTRQGRLYAAMRKNAIGVSLAARHLETNGYTRVKPSQRGPVDIPLDARQRQAEVAVLYDFSATSRLVVRGSLAAEQRGNGTPLSNNDTRSGRMHARIEWGAGGEWRADAFVSHSKYASTFSSVTADRAAEQLVLDQYSVPSRAVGGSLRRSLELGDDARLTIGADLRQIEGETRETVIFRGDDRFAGGRQLLAGSFAEVDGGASGLHWQAALRADYWRLDEGFIIQPGESREAFADRGRLVVSARAGAGWEPGPSLRLRGALYRAFRVPTINELYRPFQVGADLTLANAELDPERLVGIEGGFDWRPFTRLAAGLTLFHSVVHDPVLNVTIGASPQGGQLRQRRNIGRTEISGIELDLDYQVSPRLRGFASIAMTNARVREADTQPALVGRRLAQVAGLVATAGLHGNPGATGIGFTLQARWNGTQFEDDRNQRRLGGYLLADLALRYRLAEGAELFLAVDNLFDRRYPDGISGTGLVTEGAPRQVRAGFRREF
jgi:outer membrane receptor protein involved in Fe transport